MKPRWRILHVKAVLHRHAICLHLWQEKVCCIFLCCYSLSVASMWPLCHAELGTMSLLNVSKFLPHQTVPHSISESYRSADKSLNRPTSRWVLFDGKNISFDASLVIYIYVYINSNNIPQIVVINRIYETQSSVAVTCFLPGRAKDLSTLLWTCLNSLTN